MYVLHGLDSDACAVDRSVWNFIFDTRILTAILPVSPTPCSPEIHSNVAWFNNADSDSLSVHVSGWMTLRIATISYCALCLKNQYTWLLIITSANVDRFSKFFHSQIPNETVCVTLHGLSSHFVCFATLPCEAWKWQLLPILIMYCKVRPHNSSC